MKAARIYAYGDVDQIHIDDVARPTAASNGQVLVKIAASGLNPVDGYVRQGLLSSMIALQFPFILGLDLAGTVEAIGPGITEFKIGDRVIGKLPINGNGSNQEFVLATLGQLVKLPDNVSFEAGATLPLAGLTGRQEVETIAPNKGDRILVTGALGAVGRAAVQHLKEIGAVPVAAVRPSRLDEVKSLGIAAISADDRSQKASFAGAVDTVGGDVLVNAITLVRDGGKAVTVVQIPEGANVDKRIELISIWTKDDTAMLQQIADAAGKGLLIIPIAKTFKLSQVAEGHKMIAAGQVGGKIVFVP